MRGTVAIQRTDNTRGLRTAVPEPEPYQIPHDHEQRQGNHGYTCHPRGSTGEEGHGPILSVAYAAGESF